MFQNLNKVCLKHFAILLGMLVIWQIGAAVLREKAYRNALVILEPRNQNLEVLRKGLSMLSSLDSMRLKKLQKLSEMIENRKEEKRQAFLSLYQYHFASATMLLILSSVSFVIIFIVAQIGLNNANPYLKTVFYGLAALTSFYALSPVVYKQELNISKNLTSFLSYDNLQGEVYNYAITNQGVNAVGDTLNFEKFHSSVIDGMAKINTIDFEFDYKSIPIPDFGLDK